ncbi:MAG: beta-ketoacyl-[acyl-carrier-protein] synthase II [Candidatus Adiutrix intracellularis]|nr:MAG: beta-ketoacyl-[acyl-carrier-protein] synthase II [Candidatus Adiutrix intracellularis]MDR2827084.1 beta-ketoacyl-ACP synthase II [Candidatus Adiutrix intracellularis]
MTRSNPPRRVAVTGASLLTPVGNSLTSAWAALVAGQSGVGPITKFDPTGHKTAIAGELKDFNPENYLNKKATKRFDLFIQYSVVAAKMALSDSGLNPDAELTEKMGCIMGCGLGGLSTIETNHEVLLKRGPDRISPFFIPMMIGNMGPGQVAIELGLKGPNFLVTTACSAATHAIGWAFQLIRDQGYPAMLTGGAEAVITPLAIAGFNALNALSTRNHDPAGASRPFDKDRDGFVISEGAGLMVLEEWEHAVTRGAEIYAEVAGFGASCDAYHMTAPPENGQGAVLAMRAALDDAAATDLSLADIGYINAHGTSTGLNDLIETRAIKAVFGRQAEKLAISSTKSMTGHLLGAAGGVEGVITALTLKKGLIPPTINLDTPDPECDLDYVPKVARRANLTAAMSNSFGFGGTNGCLIFKAHSC